MRKILKSKVTIIVLYSVSTLIALLIASGELYVFSLWLASKAGIDGKVLFLCLGIFGYMIIVFTLGIAMLCLMRWINPAEFEKRFGTID